MRVRETERKCFQVRIGLRQGRVMFSWLFIIYLDEVGKEVKARVMERGKFLRMSWGRMGRGK